MKSFLTLFALAIVLNSCGIRRHDPNTVRLIPATVYSLKTDSTGKVIGRDSKIVYVPQTTIHVRRGSSSPDVSLTNGGTRSSATIDYIDQQSRSKPENSPNYHYYPKSEGEYP